MDARREIMRLDNQLCFALYSAANLTTRAYRPHLTRMGITYPQYLVLLVLWEHPQQTVSSLCEQLLLKTSTLTPVLKRLEAESLISRVRSSEDERSVEIQLTARGSRLFNEAHAMLEKVICAIDMPSVEVHVLRKQLQDLVRKLISAERTQSKKKSRSGRRKTGG